VSDVGFSWCTAPTYYSVSEYFMQESGNAEFNLQSLEIQKLSIALIERSIELGSKLEYFQKHGNQGLEVVNGDIEWTMFPLSQYSRCQIHT